MALSLALPSRLPVFVFGEGEMAGFDLGSVSCSAEVDLALAQSGINRETLLKEHQTTQTDEGIWAASSVELPKFNRTVWAITHLREKSTVLLFEGL